MPALRALSFSGQPHCTARIYGVYRARYASIAGHGQSRPVGLGEILCCTSECQPANSRLGKNCSQYGGVSSF